MKAGACGAGLHAYGLEHECVRIYLGSQFDHEMVGVAVLVEPVGVAPSGLEIAQPKPGDKVLFDHAR